MQSWDILDTRQLLDCRPWLAVYAEHVRLPNGHEIADFYRIDLPDWAQTFAVTDDGRVPCVEHYKHGAGRVSLELPAGYLDAGEAPETAARRELREEVGVEAATWRSLGRFFIDGNRGCGHSHIYLAQQARRTVEPQHEQSEIMTIRWLTLAEVRAAWLGGQVSNIATAAAIGLALAALEASP